MAKVMRKKLYINYSILTVKEECNTLMEDTFFRKKEDIFSPITSIYTSNNAKDFWTFKKEKF